MKDQTENLGVDEQCVFQFLSHWPGTFVSESEIARRADGKMRFRKEPRWAGHALTQLVVLSLAESDGQGRYRLKSRGRSTVKPGNQEKFVAPHLKNILDKNGLKFS